MNAICLKMSKWMILSQFVMFSYNLFFYGKWYFSFSLVLDAIYFKTGKFLLWIAALRYNRNQSPLLLALVIFILSLMCESVQRFWF